MPRFMNICAIAASGLVAIAPAYAAADIQPVSVKVSHADLNLATQSGRATLDQRLLAATSKVCGTSQSADLATVVAVNKCRAQAIGSARAAASAAEARLAMNTVSTR